MRLVKALDWHERLDVAPLQDEQARIRASLTVAQTEQALWLILPDGTRYRGAAAVNGALRAMFPLLGGVALALYHLPGMRQMQDAGYRWVANNRGRISRWLRLKDDGE